MINLEKYIQNFGPSPKVALSQGVSKGNIESQLGT